MSITLMHEEAAKAAPAGPGRSEPNQNPKLPTPERARTRCPLHPPCYDNVRPGTKGREAVSEEDSSLAVWRGRGS